MEESTEGKRNRGPRPKRSPETTRALLLRAVGDILREQGWQGLGVNKIAFRAGVDKKMIYWYYESYHNLIKSYLKSHDFWDPVFEDFEGSPPVNESDLPKFISSIFQDKFRSLFSDPVMQTFIHWQISEPNAALKEIVEERQMKGEKMAGLTDAHFSGSSINFRAVVALVLGGIYYMVLFSRDNSKGVCGFDINNGQEREDMIRTIGQIIELAWDAAGKESSVKKNKENGV